MSRALILYYSRTGNTRLMAESVAEGFKAIEGVDVDLKDRVEAEELASYDAVVVGVPTYHHDIPRSIKKVLEKAAAKEVDLKGKVGATFGSYGWSAEAPSLTLEILNNKFEMETIDPPLLVKYAPDQTAHQKCRRLGKRIAERLMAAV